MSQPKKQPVSLQPSQSVASLDLPAATHQPESAFAPDFPTSSSSQPAASQQQAPPPKPSAPPPTPPAAPATVSPPSSVSSGDHESQKNRQQWTKVVAKKKSKGRKTGPPQPLDPKTTPAQAAKGQQHQLRSVHANSNRDTFNHKGKSLAETEAGAQSVSGSKTRAQRVPHFISQTQSMSQAQAAAPKVPGNPNVTIEHPSRSTKGQPLPSHSHMPSSQRSATRAAGAQGGPTRANRGQNVPPRAAGAQSTANRAFGARDVLKGAKVPVDYKGLASRLDVVCPLVGEHVESLDVLTQRFTRKPEMLYKLSQMKEQSDLLYRRSIRGELQLPILSGV